MSPRSRFQILIPVLCLLLPALVRAESPLESIRKSLLASSASVRTLEAEIRKASPGFSLILIGDHDVPRPIQLRTLDNGHFVGVVNLNRIDLKHDAAEASVAGLYFLIHQEVVGHKKPSIRGCLDFQNKVREELKKSDPARFRNVRQVHPDAGFLDMGAK